MNFKSYVIDLIPEAHRTSENIEWFHSLPLIQAYISEVETGKCNVINRKGKGLEDE